MRSFVAIACFFLSGFAGLIYEIVWIRKASLVFGSTTFAVSLVLAVFFLGLALGSELAGRFARNLARPMRVYALLEFVLAVFAVLTLFLFPLADRIYGSFYANLRDNFAAATAVRALLVAALILPPTLIMGATLPLFARQFTRRRDRLAGSVGALYGINTLGAAVGCVLTGFVFIPVLGLAHSIFLGAGINLFAGLAVFFLFGKEAGPDSARAVSGEDGGEAGEKPEQARRTALLFFLVGFTALGFEILWTRYLALFLANTVHTYTITLGVVLAGIAAGSFLGALLFDRLRWRWTMLGVILASGGITALFLTSLPPAWWRSFTSDLWICAALLFLPSLLSGTAFPLVVRLVVRDPEAAAAGAGRMFAVNTVGGIAGALAVGFFLLPRHGLQTALWIVAGLAMAGGFVALWTAARKEIPPWTAALTAAGLAAIAAAIPSTLETRIPRDFLAFDGEELVDYREGQTSTLSIIREPPRGIRMEMDHWFQGTDYKTHQAVAAHIPAILHGQPRRVLVVGAGAGQTPRRYLLHEVESLDCVDIEPAVFPFIRKHFGGEWMDEPRVRLHHEDGRSFVRYSEEKFDLISLEVGQVFRPTVASFYTREFYRDARERLEAGGALCQFVPVSFLSVPDFRSVVATFIEVFPASVLWFNTAEFLLIGFREDSLPELEAEWLSEMLTAGAVGDDLEFTYWGGPGHWLSRRPVFLAGYLGGPDQLREMAGGSPDYSDNRPVLEYTTSEVGDITARNRAIVEFLLPRLSPPGPVFALTLDDEEQREITRLQRFNLGNVVAESLLHEVQGVKAGGNFEAIAKLLEDALTWNPENHLAHRQLGDASVVLGRMADAEKHYREALRIQPGDPVALRGHAFVLHRDGRYSEAAGEYRKLLKQDEFDAQAHNDLGAALVSLGQYQEALGHFEKAVALDPGLFDAMQNAQNLRKQLNIKESTQVPSIFDRPLEPVSPR